MDGVEKVICCDRGNDALAYAAMAKNNNDPMAMALASVLMVTRFRTRRFRTKFSHCVRRWRTTTIQIC